MTDKNIINIISKTYLTIVSFLSFIFLFLIVLFIVLQNGLYLDNLSISNISVKNIYIKWNEKINVSIEDIEIKAKKSKSKANNKIDYEALNRYVRVVSHTTEWFNKIYINNITLPNNTKASFQYAQKRGVFTLNSPKLALKAGLHFYKHKLSVDIDTLSYTPKSIKMNGFIVLDTDSTQIYSKLNLNIHNDANLTLFAQSDLQRLYYKVKSNKSIKDISYLINMFNLSKTIKYWAYDAIKMKELKIEELKGYLQYNDLNNAYRRLKIKATIYDLDYTYNQKLDAIHSKYTQLEFRNGIFYVFPKEAYSYGMYLNKSWVKIDFTKKEEMLAIYLLFDGVVNRDMLTILEAYDIKLPFLQKEGVVKTDLKIGVNLRTIDVEAHGKFYTKKANFDYLALNVNIYDALIKLDNYNVTINKMGASYKDIAKAIVDVTFDTKKSQGDIRFKVEDITFAPTALKLKDKGLKVLYKISPKGDLIYVDKSSWYVKNRVVNFEKAVLPFDLKTNTLHIPTTMFHLKDIANGYVSGWVNVKNKTASLDTDILNFAYNGIELEQCNTPLKIQYDKNLKISSKDNIYFNVSGSRYKLKDLNIEFKEHKIYLKRTELAISNYIKTKLNAYYDIKKKRAHISINDFRLQDQTRDKILYYNKKMMLSVIVKDENITIESKKLNADFISNTKGWFLHIDSIDRIAKNSDLLKKYKLTEGEIKFYKYADDKYTRFSSTIHYPYKILTKQDKPVSEYTINGKITKSQKIYLNVNKKINVKIGDDIRINMKNGGINLDEVIRLVKDITKDTHTTNSKLNLSFNAVDSYLYLGSNRYVLSDRINLQYFDKILTAQLKYVQGEAGLKLEKGDFHLYGKNFNDKFMQKLLSLAKFRGGTLEFSMNGKIDDYDGIFYVKKTTILDYKLLNNVLAFVNTVPSLITFSLPGYDTEGLRVSQGYMKFHAKNDFFDVSDVYLESKELKIIGKGTADLPKNKIDLLLNLKTDLGSGLAKVPLVGYILLDGESISTTLKINGKLTNPNVELQLARDIAVAPINIITRTLTLPYKLISDLFEDDNETNQTNK